MASVLRLCLVPLAILCSTAAAQSWDWSVDTPPYAGGNAVVSVDNAPAFPVTVELWIDGAFVCSVVLTAAGDATLPVPSGTSNKPYTIKVISGTRTESAHGTVN